jgi:hypothetical protein
MTYQQEDHKPLQPIEVSLKYMAWNIKEISESQKTICKYIEIIAKNQMQQMQQTQKPNGPTPVRTMHDRNEEVPF